jgi:serine/threonine-protein kinase
VADDRLIGEQIGDFDVVEAVGRGAFATVYRARQRGVDRDVALKVLDPMLGRNLDAARRFDGEAHLAATLDHPSILPVYAAGADNEDHHYLAMRFVEGESFDDELRRTGPASRARTLEVVRRVADALDHAHAHGVIHRDVKPANILVDGDNVWLTDFGIAASAHTLGRYTTGALGTVEYMAPEQAKAGDIDGRADLYSLGCVAFEALTGRPPYEGDDLVVMLMAHANEPIPSTGDVALDAFMLRALARDPDARFSSGAEFVDGFERALGGAIVEPPASERAERRTRTRHRTTAVIAAVAIAVAVIAFVVISRRGSPDAAALRTDLRGPTRVHDPNGARYAIPKGWTVSGVTPDAQAYTTSLARNGVDAARITAAPAAASDSAASVAARSEDWKCSAHLQQSAQIGTVSGVFCTFAAPGAADVYYVVADGRAWTIVAYTGTVPTDEIRRFRESFTFG